MRPEIKEALAYLENGGMVEVTYMAELALEIGQKEVTSESGMAMALCILAAEALERRRFVQ